MSLADQVLAIYKQNRSGGQYVRAASATFRGISGDNFKFLIENAKKGNISIEQPENWKALAKKTWETDVQFKDSAPVKAMKSFEEKMKKVCEDHKMLKTGFVAWGAFVQAFQNDIRDLVVFNWTVVPDATPFHYSRAFYMVNTSAENYVYLTARMSACIRVYRALLKDGAPFEKYKPGDAESAKEFTNWCKTKYPKLVGVATPEFLDELRKKPISSLIDEGDFAETCAGAYIVKCTMLLQSQDLRITGIKPSHTRACARAFLQVVPDHKGKVDIKESTGAPMKTYYEKLKHIRLATATMRRVLSGDNRQTGPKKDYSAFSFDVAEAEEKLDWTIKDAKLDDKMNIILAKTGARKKSKDNNNKSKEETKKA